MHVERANRIVELSTLNATMQRMNALLEDAQQQLVQSEKMASIGQIAAGVAHEINNPIGYVLSNLGTLDSYLARVFGMLDSYITGARPPSAPPGDSREQPPAERKDADFEFLRNDIVALLAESRDGILRVKHIVQDLKDFSRGGVDEAWDIVNLHDALDRTLNIVRNEVKYKAKIETHYGTLPDVECLPSRLHQVFLNLIVNAGQAIEASGKITITTGSSQGEVWIRFEDTGCGIPKEHLNRIFEPFYTTKPVGQGTGLGLSVSYSIVHRHGGSIEVESELGHGSRFTIRLPVRQPHAQGETAATPVEADTPAPVPEV
jgi:two-component system NtrC family sensor kinase